MNLGLQYIEINRLKIKVDSFVALGPFATHVTTSAECDHREMAEDEVQRFTSQYSPNSNSDHLGEGRRFRC